MRIKHLTVVAALVAALISGPLHAALTHSPYIDAQAPVTEPLQLRPLPMFSELPSPAKADRPAAFRALLVKTTPALAAAQGAGAEVADSALADADAAMVDSVTDLRKALIGMAMKLRDTRYVRGGRDPSTGFDCSGFVRYVFAHAIGMQLPTNSASQFLAGLKVKRADMKPGDLVFFHTTRSKHRVSHVGIYISNGRFIHSPSAGKSVEISSLASGYWAKRFVGAKRPEAIAMAANNG